MAGKGSAQEEKESRVNEAVESFHAMFAHISTSLRMTESSRVSPTSTKRQAIKPA